MHFSSLRVGDAIVCKLSDTQMWKYKTENNFKLSLLFGNKIDKINIQ